MTKHKVIGLMSGTSLDGVDIAYCQFEWKDEKWNYHILKAETFPYSELWKQRLSEIMKGPAIDYVKTDVELGRFYGGLIKDFIAGNGIQPSLIASHGHTVFHQPQNGFTAQIGDGSQISAITGIDTVCDFRSKDLGLGGQGAPLVPGGEKWLFSRYQFCLNLGGIANISVIKSNSTVAYDVCPANMALNYLVEQRGMFYDNDGLLARKGKINTVLLEQLDRISYYSLSYPKSLGREWFEKEFRPILDGMAVSTEDKLATCCEHIAIQIGLSVKAHSFKVNDQFLVTGGGAFNSYLLERIHEYLPLHLVIPDKQTIAFKEALIFAFLGLLFMLNEKNVMCSVTGAVKDHIGGALYKGV